MPDFRFKAVTADGETITGRLSAASEAGAVAHLIQQGHYPIETRIVRTADPRRRTGKGRRRDIGLALLRIPGLGRRPDRMTRRALDAFTRDLAHMTGAGLTIDQALSVMADSAAQDGMRASVEAIRGHLRAGASLSAALERHGAPFNPLYTALVRAGESAGALPAVLGRLAGYLARMRALQNTVTSAMIYPLALLAATVVSVTILMTTVVPRFEALFQRAGTSLPPETRMVMAASEAFAAGWWVIALGGLGGTMVLSRALRRPAWRRKIHGAFLEVPLLGPALRKIDLSRFARALGLMLDSGVSMLPAYRQAVDVVGNARLAADLDALSERLRAGTGLADPLIASGLFPGSGGQLVRLGEETGRLGPMLIDVADMYDGEVETAIKRALAVMEPAIILTLGLLIGAIVLSLFSAMTGLQDVVF